MAFEFINKLPTPAEIKEQFPLPTEFVALKAKRDEEVKKVISGESDKFLVIIGPCSADNEDAVLDYTSRLINVQEKTKDRLVIVPRIYTNKPRTTGDGYKGMLHQPDPEKRPSMAEGLHAIRHMHMRVLKETGFSTADEMLYPDNVSYAYSDYAYNQVMELIDRYEPSVLWNDIGWPVKGYTDLPYLISYYYNRVPEGVISDRWMVNKDDFWYDFSTKEYQVGAARVDKKWEMTRGLGLSFGYNQTEGEADCIGKDELIRLLIDTVAHNGNLLLNIGPKADGTIPSVQEERLLYLGAWLEQNGEGIYGTRPYRTPELKEKNGDQLYFTQKGDTVYLFVAAPQDGENVICMENIFGTTVKLTDLQGNEIPYEMEDELLRFTVNAKGTAPVAVRVQI